MTRFSVRGSFDLIICSHHDGDSQSGKIYGSVYAAGAVSDIVRAIDCQLSTLVRSYYRLERSVSVDDRRIGIDWDISVDGSEISTCSSVFRTDDKLEEVVSEFKMRVSALVRERLESRQRIAKENFERAKEDLASISFALLNLPGSDSEE